MPDDQKPPDAATTDAELDAFLKVMVERANALQALIDKEQALTDRPSLLALTLVAATAAQRSGLSMNDAFALYLSVHESVDQAESDRMRVMFKHMKNSITDLMARDMKKPPTTH